MDTITVLPRAIYMWLLQYTPIYLAGVMLGGDKPMSLPAMIDVERYFLRHRRAGVHDFGYEDHCDECLKCGAKKP